MASPRAGLLDAHGTLFDVHSAGEAGRALTDDPQALAALWRQKQLEYTWLRSLVGRPEDFWALTEAALRHAAQRLGLQAREERPRGLMEAYLSLAAFPEVPAPLERLRGRPPGIEPDLEVSRLDEIADRLDG